MAIAEASWLAAERSNCSTKGLTRGGKLLVYLIASISLQTTRVFVCRECRFRRPPELQEKLQKVGKSKSSGPFDF